MGTFFGFIAALFAVLQIVLFFKIWGMTNDIREIKEKYLSPPDPKKSVPLSNNQPTEFSMGELVVGIKTNKQMGSKRLHRTESIVVIQVEALRMRVTLQRQRLSILIRRVPI